MADQFSNEGSSTGNISAECSDSTVQLNIKTLDSRIYSFQVNKNMPVSLFKEKIANEIGVPVSQQRLIFRGKVLKDEHVLSEYHVENGHTLHLVERQPNQPQASGTSADEHTGTSSNQGLNSGNDVGSGPPRNRLGQISHSVVLGTFNVGEQGEGIVHDITRVIGHVLNSIGNGGQSTVNGPNAVQTSSAQPGNETEGIRAGNQNPAGNQAPSGQTFHGPTFQSVSHVQIPVAAGSIPLPSLNAPIPDSLNTLIEFMNRMEQTLTQNGYQSNFSSANPGDQRVELPSNTQGMPTLEALSTVLRRAERLLGGQTVAALSHIAGRLERERASADPRIRGQIQSESEQIGLAMQHLGALLLELGRTMLTLRMGQSSVESVVNAGPAVYISPSGPNPIMAQPFPLQTSSLFGGPLPSSTPGNLGSIGIGGAPRNVSIHIHAGTSVPIVSAIGSRPNNGEGARSEQLNEPGSDGSSSTRQLPVRNVIATTIPSHPPGVGVSSSTQTGFSVSSSQPPDSASLSSALAEINARLMNVVGSMQGDNAAPSGEIESISRDSSSGSESRPSTLNAQQDTMEPNFFGASSASLVGSSSESELQTEAVQTSSNAERDVLVDEFVSSSKQDLQSCSSGETIVKPEKDGGVSAVSDGQDVTEPAKSAPLGLGMGGLERKKRNRPQPPVSKVADDGSSSSSVDKKQTRTDGQHILQTLASHGSALNSRNANGPSQRPLPSSDRPIDVAGLMSQALQSPALNGLLEGVSQQTGVDSPDGLRNMLQQFTQSPQLMNTVNQIVQQVGSQDVGNMFAGAERGQGGGIDISRMFQQMMPIVSRALGGANPSSLFSIEEAEPGAPHQDGTVNRDEYSDNPSLQLDLQPLAERIEHLSPSVDIFGAVAENAVQLSGLGSLSNDLLEELCHNESLAREYVDMLRYDVSKLLEGRSEADKS
ncbi:ubiquitin-like domain-containing protein CIP73 isoform X1 [Vigna umbellata]|uniref:ubiquitin-like domain-containing protein CIP73 isoform X1 n=1 Tax=Vigna umbellata TaxID=87088 RepID=UPI001F5ED6F7|nr:ubiquitin-like domain-containing protein CIP73 isoform X1 [Vigna umbellata]XP_047159926.1 ubiquitin-like domain-containing protein CIP73 isoform X1 [Vigna umbellata]